MRYKLKSELKFEAGMQSPTICFCSDSPDPPDYKPVADASEEAARIAAALGDRQLAETRRQYDLNMRVAQPVINAQTAQMNELTRQGADYYNYMVAKQRPVENELNRLSMLDTSAASAAERKAIQDRISQSVQQDNAERGLITGGNAGIYNARRDDIDAMTRMAMADANQQIAAQRQMQNRNMASYGINPNSGKFAGMDRAAAMDAARLGTQTSNAARMQGINSNRGLMAQGYDMRQATDSKDVQGMLQNRNLRLQDDASGWAKKLDVAGLYRGLPGASQGAYGLATQSGNSAVANQMQPSNQLLSGTNQSAGITQTGLGQQLTGLGGVLGAQTSVANNSSGSSGIGSLIGSGLGAWASTGFA